MHKRSLFALCCIAALLWVSALAVSAAPALDAPDAAAQSDDFDSCSLGSAWTYIQGQPGDPAPAFNGAHLILTAQGGVDHDIWDYGVLAQRIMQPVSDEDFEYEVKFASAMDSRFQTRGILIQGPGADVLRFETHHDGTSYRHFASDIVGGVADTEHNAAIPQGDEPSHMRVTRSGDMWTHSYSVDGSTWVDFSFDLAFSVEQVGPYIGNTSVNAPGTEPEHVGLIDYFYNTAARGAGDSGANVHDLTVNVNGQGAVAQEPDRSIYGCDEAVKLTATPQAGWVFDGWSGALSGRDNPATVVIDGDKNVTATFIEQQAGTFLLDLSVTVGGSVTRAPDKAAYNAGEEVTLTATADTGWIFDGWTGDVTDSDAEITVTMDANKSVTAAFSPQTFTLALPVNGNGTVTPSPDKSAYDAGETVTLTASGAPGWGFERWSGDLSGSDNPVDITMDGDKNILAIFSEEAFTGYDVSLFMPLVQR